MTALSMLAGVKARPAAPESKEHLRGFAVVDVPSHEEALEWAAKVAVACRCPQEGRELLPDPTLLIEGPSAPEQRSP